MVVTSTTTVRMIRCHDNKRNRYLAIVALLLGTKQCATAELTVCMQLSMLDISYVVFTHASNDNIPMVDSTAAYSCPPSTTLNKSISAKCALLLVPC
eukprot:6193494-Pleurochrysis_carterae.AAC.1